MMHAHKPPQSLGCRGLVLVLIISVTCLAGRSVPAGGPATPAGVESKTVPAASSNCPKVHPKVDEVLTAMQRRSDAVRDIHCKIVVDEDDTVDLVSKRREGRLKYLAAKPNPLIMIHFSTVRFGNVLGRPEWYFFDGRWLYEAKGHAGEMAKKEIAREGERLNLFDIETSPFPLPFGQDKERILAAFDVAYAPPVPADRPKSDHLVCVPKPGSRMDGRFDRLDFFVSQTEHLPIEIRLTQARGYKTTTVVFEDLEKGAINVGLDRKKDFATPQQWRNCKVVVERLPEPDSGRDQAREGASSPR